MFTAYVIAMPSFYLSCRLLNMHAYVIVKLTELSQSWSRQNPWTGKFHVIKKRRSKAFERPILGIFFWSGSNP